MQPYKHQGKKIFFSIFFDDSTLLASEQVKRAD